MDRPSTPLNVLSCYATPELRTHMESHKLLSFNLFIFSVFFFWGTFPSGTISLSFNFTSFDRNGDKISFDAGGDAAYSPEGCILLTRNQNDKKTSDSWGRALYSERLHLWDPTSRNVTDFTTNFSFVINSLNESWYGDGITFFLNGTQLTPDARGEGLGLTNDTLANLTAISFLAVEFDTYPNKDQGDPKVDHVGIDINSTRSVKTANWSSSIRDGQLNHAFINYDATSHNLSVILITEEDTENDTTSLSISYQVDLRFLPEFVTIGFSGATGSSFEINKICSWSFSSTLKLPTSVKVKPGEGKKTALQVGLIAGFAFVVVGGLGWLWLWLWHRHRSGKKKRNTTQGDRDEEDGVAMDEDFEKGTGPRKFSFDELAIATSNFAEEEKVGEGGFGGVYRGFLNELNSYVAVKRVSSNSKQGMKEYAAEIKIFCRLRHRNLVQLMGWCHQKGDLLLVYEYLPNGSLSHHLFEESTQLTWARRHRIALGLASSLLYLHEESEQCVVHRDIKSSNVMLDSDFNAKLGDFGLARLVDHGKGPQSTALAGTMGYMAPECFLAGKASKESDVYSFGIVALEICCGRRAVESKAAQENQIKLVEWVWELYGVGKLLEAADPRLSADYDEQEMERLMIVGLWCAHPDSKSRASMRQAISVLNSEALLPLLPIKMPIPMYYAPSELQTSYSSRTSISERNQKLFSSSSNATTDSSRVS